MNGCFNAGLDGQIELVLLVSRCWTCALERGDVDAALLLEPIMSSRPGKYKVALI